MSTKLEKNLRKIIIKNFNQKNASNPLFKNKKLPNIKIKNEIPTQTNENKKYIKRKSKTDANMLHNDYKILQNVLNNK